MKKLCPKSVAGRVGIIVGILAIVIAAVFVYYIVTTNSALEKIGDKGNQAASPKTVSITEEPFNVYVTGIDTYGTIDKVSRSDVNMIMTVDPKKKRILLTSIPRDYYVKLHSFGELDKLTHSGTYGVQETVETGEDFLDIDINYYVRVNFSSVEDIVDILGGIDVESVNAFSTGGYSFVVGTNHLNGKEALAFARERHSFKTGDNERVKNQQRVLSAIINKLTTSPRVLTKYSSLMKVVGEDVQTNMSPKEIRSLALMQIKDREKWEIETISLTGTGTLDTTYSMGARMLYVVIPNEKSVKVAHEKIEKMIGVVTKE